MANSKFWSSDSSKPKPLVLDAKGFSKKVKFNYKKIGTGAGITLGVLLVLFIISYVLVIKPALALKKSADVIKQDFAQMQQAAIARDIITLQQTFDKTEKDLNALRKQRDAEISWAKGFGPTKEYYADSDRFINAGLYGIDAGREAVKLVLPFADAAGLKVTPEQQSQADEVSLMEAVSTWVSIMPQIANDSDVVIAKVAKIGDELEPINTEKYPEEFNGVKIRSTIEVAKNSLSQVNEYAPDIKKALLIVPGLLGVGTGEQRYMIIMQNDKELRATGGFWTNYATFKIENAMLKSDFSSKDMYSIDYVLDRIDKTFTFPTVPPSYNRYLKVERLYARDSNISPDFPTAIDQFMYLYNIAGQIDPVEIKPVVGIFAIDTEVIAELLEVTGPVTVNGITYDSDNVVLELEKIASLALREQQNRKKVLGDLMEAMLINVFESDKNLWPKMIDKGVDLAVRKHIIGYHFDPEAQALLEKYNFAGRIIDPVVGDYGYVVSTNLGGDKTNWFVNKEVDHVITQEGGKWMKTVRIKYTYNRPEDRFSPFIYTFRDWVRVYAPVGSQFIDVVGSEDGTTTGEERGKTYFTGYLQMSVGETKEMTFKYYLPDSAVKDGKYDFYLQKQAGVGEETHRITVKGQTTTVKLDKDYKYSTAL